MLLSEWLKAKGIRGRAFAARIDRSPSTVSRIARGEVEPNRETRDLIIRETGGAVTAADLLTNGSGFVVTSRKNGGRRNGA